jgi:Ni,Fe-hydrogenase I cytochrome b subunit
VANEPKDETQQGYSLFIFSPTNPFRIFLRDFVQNNYFAGFIYHMIALNSLLLALDEPKLSDPYQQKTISNLLLIISIIFVVEMVVKIIVVGFYIGERTYLKDSWNILDFIIVMFSILTWIMEAAAGADISFIRGFRALRALRPLRVVSKNEGIKTVVNSLLLSIPALLNVLLIVLLFLMVFGILGIQLFMGKLGNCNDHELPDGTIVENRSQCHGWFKVDIINADGVVIGWERQKREWLIPINNYDNIFYSMMTFFEISTLEMWPGMMYAAIDSVGIDMVPILDNSQWVSILFIVFIFFTTFFIMNLFISVIVDKFNEEIKKRQGSDNFTDEQKEWVKI